MMRHGVVGRGHTRTLKSALSPAGALASAVAARARTLDMRWRPSSSADVGDKAPSRLARDEGDKAPSWLARDEGDKAPSRLARDEGDMGPSRLARAIKGVNPPAREGPWKAMEGHGRPWKAMEGEIW